MTYTKSTFIPLAAVVFLVCSSVQAHAALIYNISQSAFNGPSSVSGTIETDGTIGAINAVNVLSWAFTLDDGVGTVVSLSSTNGTLDLAGRTSTGFFATQTEVTFPFSGNHLTSFNSGVKYLAFDGSLSESRVIRPDFTGMNWNVGGRKWIKRMSGSQVVGTASTVPAPTSMLLMGSGLLGLAGYRWSQRRREGTQLE